MFRRASLVPRPLCWTVSMQCTSSEDIVIPAKSTPFIGLTSFQATGYALKTWSRKTTSLLEINLLLGNSTTSSSLTLCYFKSHLKVAQTYIRICANFWAALSAVQHFTAHLFSVVHLQLFYVVKYCSFFLNLQIQFVISVSTVNETRIIMLNIMWSQKHHWTGLFCCAMKYFVTLWKEE